MYGCLYPLFQLNDHALQYCMFRAPAICDRVGVIFLVTPMMVAAHTEIEGPDLYQSHPLLYPQKESDSELGSYREHYHPRSR